MRKMVRGSAAVNAYREAGELSALYKKIHPKVGPKLSVIRKLGMRDDSPDGVVMQTISQLTSDQANKIWNSISDKYTCDVREQYRYCLHAVETYEYTKPLIINASSKCGSVCLPADECSTFEVDIPVPEDQTYVNEQFFRTKLRIVPFTEEQLQEFEANPPAGIEPVEMANPDFDDTMPIDPDTNPEFITVNFDRNNIRYEFTELPGIRLMKEVRFLSDTTCMESYNYLNMLTWYYEMMPHESKELFNKLIGQDDGVYTDAVFPDSDIVFRALARLCHQTPKKEQDELFMHIPLMFEHNKTSASKLNLGVIRNKTIRVTGQLTKGNNMARATYMCGTRPVVCLGNPTICIEQMELVGAYGKYVDNIVDSINVKRSWKNFFRQWHNQTATIRDVQEDKVVLRTKSIVEAFLVAVRPASYEDDFDLWRFMQPVTCKCVPMPILVDDKLELGDNRNCLAVGPSTSYKPECVVKKIGLRHGVCTELEAVETPEVYTDLSKWKMANSHLSNTIRINTGIHYIKVNDYFPLKKFSNIGNFAGLDKSEICIEFKDDLCDSDDKLNQDYQVIVMASTLNSYFSHGQIIAKEYSR